MIPNHAHHPLRQTLAPIGFEHEYVGEVSERGVVRDHPREAGLLAAFVESEAKRVLDGTDEHLERNPRGPVGFRVQVAVHRFYIEEVPVGADDEVACAPFHKQVPNIARWRPTVEGFLPSKGLIARTGQETCATRTMRLFETIRQDARHAIRLLLQNRGFAAVAILSL